MNRTPMIIYNLFPKLIGTFDSWKPHIERAKEMGFTAIYINPIQYPGFSGSCYSIKDYFRIHEIYTNPGSSLSADEQFRRIVDFCHENDMRIFMDLVINHTAVDSDLVREHPEWYMRNPDGTVQNPVARDGEKIVAVWGDLAEIDNAGSSDKKALWNYWLEVVNHYLAFGIDGFRCDAAYQVPVELWEFLISSVRTQKTHFTFLAETLGCSIEDVKKLGQAGFDFTFNSSKYWNFYDSWCIDQYHENFGISESISFPESHDTIRLGTEANGNEVIIKQRYLFSSVFSAGLMMPIGFEYGFRQKPDVVHSTPENWEEKHMDLVDYIKKCNRLKHDYPVFSEESELDLLSDLNSSVLIIHKKSVTINQEALIILNKDTHQHQHVHIGNLSGVFSKPGPLVNVSPEFPENFVPENFDYYLRPGQIILILHD